MSSAATRKPFPSCAQLQHIPLSSQTPKFAPAVRSSSTSLCYPTPQNLPQLRAAAAHPFVLFTHQNLPQLCVAAAHPSVVPHPKTCPSCAQQQHIPLFFHTPKLAPAVRSSSTSPYSFTPLNLPQLCAPAVHSSSTSLCRPTPQNLPQPCAARAYPSVVPHPKRCVPCCGRQRCWVCTPHGRRQVRAFWGMQMAFISACRRWLAVVTCQAAAAAATATAAVAAIACSAVVAALQLGWVGCADGGRQRTRSCSGAGLR